MPSLYLVLTRSWLGRAIRASAENPQGAELVGVNVASVAALTFAIGVASAGAGGSIASVLYPFLPGSHYHWISRLLGIIVLGGMGSLPGAVIGALCLGLAELMTVDLHLAGVGHGACRTCRVHRAAAEAAGDLGTRLRQDVATA